MYRIIYSDDSNSSWELEGKVFKSAKEAHEFAIEEYFYTVFHIVKICIIGED